MNKIEYLTIRELAEKIINKMEAESSIDLANVDCDFAVVEDKSVPYTDARGWYGIKRVKLGFDSTAVNLVCDYYGGSDAQICSIYDDLLDCCINDVKGMIANTLESESEYSSDEDLLIVEWLEEKVKLYLMGNEISDDTEIMRYLKAPICNEELSQYSYGDYVGNFQLMPTQKNLNMVGAWHEKYNDKWNGYYYSDDILGDIAPVYTEVDDGESYDVIGYALI